MFQNSGFIKIDFAYFASSWNIFVNRSWIVGSLFCFLLLINLSPFDRINFAISVLLFPLFSPIDEGLIFVIRITWFAEQIVAYTLQIFIVILLCKSIKSMRVIYNLMIENFFCKFYHWNPGMAKQLSKSSKNKSQCWSELLWVYNRF